MQNENIKEFLDKFNVSSKNILDIYLRMDENKDDTLNKAIDKYFDTLKKQFKEDNKLKEIMIEDIICLYTTSNISNCQSIRPLLTNDVIKNLTTNIDGISTLYYIYNHVDDDTQDYLLLQLKNCKIDFSILKESQTMFDFISRLDQSIIYFNPVQLDKIYELFIDEVNVINTIPVKEENNENNSLFSRIKRIFKRKDK